MNSLVDTKELTKLADIIKMNGDPLNTSFFKELQLLFSKIDTIQIHEYGNIKEQEGKVVFAGPRFANVVLPNGVTVSLNYGSIVAFGSNKEDGACSISF